MSTAGPAGARVSAIRLPTRSAVSLAMAGVVGLAAFFWPFAAAPGAFGSGYTAPLMFAALLLLVLAVLFAQIADGGIDSKALAMLGVLSAVNASLRPLGAGTAGVATVFYRLVLAGRV
jgi:energy-coupling factor transport system substrate-specific component